MLNRLCILSEHWERAIVKSQLFQNPICLFRVGKNTGSFADLFQLLYTSDTLGQKKPTIAICLDFSGGGTLPDNEAECSDKYAFLCNLVFHPLYYVQYNAPVLFYRKDAGEDNKVTENISFIEAQLLNQGFSNVHFVELARPADAPLGKSVPVIEAGSASLPTFYKDAFLNCGIYNQYFVIADHNTFSFAHTEKELLQAEQTFADENPVLYQTLQCLSQVSEEAEALRWKNHNATLELENHKTYLKLLLAQDEAPFINNFYYHEYEILPLWYKRFGHILKVLTGKRTFRSLFDDNVKKYT